MENTLLHIISTPYFWQSLGFVTAISMFISPVLYNGNYKMATKTIVVTFGYGALVGLINYFHLAQLEGKTSDLWLQPLIILGFVGLAYILGLYIGVYINRKQNPK